MGHGLKLAGCADNSRRFSNRSCSHPREWQRRNLGQRKDVVPQHSLESSHIICGLIGCWRGWSRSLPLAAIRSLLHILHSEMKKPTLEAKYCKRVERVLHFYQSWPTHLKPNLRNQISHLSYRNRSTELPHPSQIQKSAA